MKPFNIQMMQNENIDNRFFEWYYFFENKFRRACRNSVYIRVARGAGRMK